VIWSGNGGPNPPVILWDSSIEVVISVQCVLEFFPIFVLGFDLVFLEFRAVPSNDFLEMSQCFVEFYLGQVWGRFMEL
jgi:hypothetical protein